MASAWGNSWGALWGNSWGVVSAETVETISGNHGYSYSPAWQKEKSKDELRKKLALAQAELDKAADKERRLKEQLAKAAKLAAKKRAEKERALELKLAEQEQEIARLVLLLQTLEALLREWDEEDALIALLLSSPF